jgi:AcrR family transcriptional regulator
LPAASKLKLELTELAMTLSNTKDNILDQAETLFAKQGYKATSLRQITTAARANLAAVSYHFGSKEGLVAAVIGRRLAPLNEQRHERLQKIMARAEAEERRPATHEILLAFIEPTMRLPESAAGAGNFVTLIGRALADPDQTARQIFFQHMGPVMKLFYDALALALPGLPSDVLYWRLNFLIGALSHTMRAIDKCPLPLPGAEPRDARQLVDLLLPFLCAGMEAGE